MQFLIQHDGEQFGPFSEAKVRDCLKLGAFKPDDLARTEGMKDWTPLRDLLPSTESKMPEGQHPKKQERTAKARNSFLAVRDFVDRLLTPQKVLALTVLLLIASWAYRRASILGITLIMVSFSYSI